ncbi:alkylphosphonate utilization protein [Hydrogenophaga sp. PAMC20947]|uniref:alkylphosphonate utilization protein n=1 Tax=Hydrogenophaga sp. PAMC20947 TaxID=2565558 RepID=UPI001FFAC01A|nr:alkylphosphonate utilization protein [Hydrogenophaga sp. PAMC20947]
MAYPDGDLLACPGCGHAWRAGDEAETTETVSDWRDAGAINSTTVVTMIKDLKRKGSSLVLKVGTKARNNRRLEGDHDIDCKGDGVGAMQLKSAMVKKA